MCARNAGVAGAIWVAGAMLLTASCEESIALGSECLATERCAGDGAPRASPSSSDAGRGLGPSDAQTVDARSDVGLDASPPDFTLPERLPDAGRGFDARAVENGEDGGSRDARFSDDQSPADAELAQGDAGDPGDVGVVPTRPDAAFPALENGSFTLTKGVLGPLAYEPLDPLAIGTNLAEPWAACRPGFSVVESANASDGPPAVTVVPSEGTTFVEANLNVIDIIDLMGLRQALQTPLRAGERYALRVDVRASLGANATLELWASHVDCVPALMLASLGTISESEWTSACVAFVAPMDFAELILAPSRLDAEDNTAARVFFDNVRPGTDCE